MRQQHPEGNFLVRVMGVPNQEGKLIAHIIIQVQLSIFVKLQYPQGGDRLGAGGDQNRVLSLTGSPVPLVLHAIASRPNQLSFLDAGHLQAHQVRFLHFPLEVCIQGLVS
jgi:hypothetical protein